MSEFQDAVKRVQADAARSDWSVLATVLHDARAERAARLVAANLLARAGTPGTDILRSAWTSGDDRTKVTALRAYLQAQTVLDEALVLQTTHDKSALVRLGVRRLLNHLPYPVSETFRLRCYLPAPYCDAPQPEDELAGWLRATDTSWDARLVIINTIARLRYRPALPALVAVMRYSSRDRVADAIIGFGTDAVPALIEALPASHGSHRIGILHALQRIGGPEATAALRSYSTWPVFNPLPQSLR